MRPSTRPATSHQLTNADGNIRSPREPDLQRGARIAQDRDNAEVLAVDGRLRTHAAGALQRGLGGENVLTQHARDLQKADD